MAANVVFNSWIWILFSLFVLANVPEVEPANNALDPSANSTNGYLNKVIFLEIFSFCMVEHSEINIRVDSPLLKLDFYTLKIIYCNFREKTVHLLSEEQLLVPLLRH